MCFSNYLERFGGVGPLLLFPFPFPCVAEVPGLGGVGPLLPVPFPRPCSGAVADVPGLATSGRGHRMSFWSSVTNSRMLSCKYHCRCGVMPAGDTATGAVGGNALASLVSNVKDVSAESSDTLTNTLPDAVASNRKCW